MKTSLFTIETEYLELISQVEQAEGELTPELEEALMINEAQLQGKSTAYLQVITTKEGINDAISNEIKRLQAIKKQNDNTVTKLRSRLLEAVKLFGDFKVGYNSFGTRKSSSVNVENVNTLPKKFKTIKITESANKQAIKDAIKAGEEIEGCSIVENLNLKIG